MGLFKRRNHPSRYARARHRRVIRQNKEHIWLREQEQAGRRRILSSPSEVAADLAAEKRTQKALIAMGGPKIVDFLRKEGLTPSQISSFFHYIGSNPGTMTESGSSARINLPALRATIRAERIDRVRSLQRHEQRNPDEMLLEHALSMIPGTDPEAGRKNVLLVREQEAAKLTAFLKAVQKMINTGYKP